MISKKIACFSTLSCLLRRLVILMNKYIIPGYIKIENRKDGIYLTNQYTNKIIRLDYKFSKDLQDIIDYKYSNNVSQVVSFLRENEMLIRDTDFESCIRKYTESEDETLSIIIFTTEQCNFRCKYCYESFKLGNMKDELYETIYCFAKKKLESGAYKHFCLNWFGGEPLLCYKNISKYNSKLSKLSSDYGVTFISNITTNGYLLTSNVFDELYSSGIKMYQITMDGSFHDELRVLKNGGKTKDAIIKNLSNILADKEKQFTIILRNNILKDNHDYQWYDQIAKTFNLDERIAIHVHPVSPLGGDNHLNMIRDKKELEGLLNDHVSYLTRIGLKNYDDNIETSMCYAALRNNYAFRPNGELVTCTVDLEEERNHIGNFSETKIKIDYSKLEQWSNKINYEKCKTCSNFFYCPMNSCPSKKGNEKYCIYKKQSLNQETDYV